jgi:predicted ribosome quality control (RQC) complex YloA/Tae2 family protein
MANGDKIYPVAMKSIVAEKEFKSFNNGLDSLGILADNNDKKTKEVRTKKSKTASLLELQQKRIVALEKEIAEAQACGEFIYEHYQEFQKLLDSIKLMRKNGKSYDEIEEELQKNKRFKKLDKANKRISMVFTK